MKIKCEYCDSVINTRVDDECPNCGASYANNKEYLEYKKTEKEINKHFLDVFKKTQKTAFIIPVVAMIFIIIIFLSIVTSFNKSSKQVSNIINNRTTSTTTTTKKVQEKLTVNYREEAVLNNYKVMVDSYEVFTSKFYKPGKGNEFVTFHFLVTNISNKPITSLKVYCIVDGVSQNTVWDTERDELPSLIATDLKVQGNYAFEVPKNAKSYDIRYGDYVTIHIEK